MTGTKDKDKEKNTKIKGNSTPTTEHKKTTISQTLTSKPFLMEQNKGSSSTEPPTPPTVVHYVIRRNQQLRVQISHRVTKPPPSQTQEWTDFLFHEMMEKPISRLTHSSKWLRQIMVGTLDSIPGWYGWITHNIIPHKYHQNQRSPSRSCQLVLDKHQSAPRQGRCQHMEMW